MSNFIKRILTSLPLIILIFVALINQFYLLIILLFISYFLFNEFYNILKKMYLNKKILFFSNLIATLYIIFFSVLIFFYLSADNQQNELKIVYILLVCISTDVGGYIFGKTFKGKKLTRISPNKTFSGMYSPFFKRGEIIALAIRPRPIIPIDSNIFILSKSCGHCLPPSRLWSRRSILSNQIRSFVSHICWRCFLLK